MGQDFSGYLFAEASVEVELNFGVVLQTREKAPHFSDGEQGAVVNAKVEEFLDSRQEVSYSRVFESYFAVVLSFLVGNMDE